MSNGINNFTLEQSHRMTAGVVAALRLGVPARLCLKNKCVFSRKTQGRQIAARQGPASPSGRAASGEENHEKNQERSQEVIENKASGSEAEASPEGGEGMAGDN